MSWPFPLATCTVSHSQVVPGANNVWSSSSLISGQSVNLTVPGSLLTGTFPVMSTTLHSSSTDTATPTGASTPAPNHSSSRVAAIVVPLVLGLLMASTLASCWWRSRRREKMRRDGVEAKAVWLVPEYVDGIRKKMMEMDETKVGIPDGVRASLSQVDLFVAAADRNEKTLDGSGSGVLGDETEATTHGSQGAQRRPDGRIERI